MHESKTNLVHGNGGRSDITAAGGCFRGEESFRCQEKDDDKGMEITMDFSLHQKIKLKKPHPCGSNQWEILRTGMDFRLKCLGCGHQVMLPRKAVEKGFRGFV